MISQHVALTAEPLHHMKVQGATYDGHAEGVQHNARTKWKRTAHWYIVMQDISSSQQVSSFPADASTPVRHSRVVCYALFKQLVQAVFCGSDLL